MRPWPSSCATANTGVTVNTIKKVGNEGSPSMKSEKF
jgi:hypothetical protein